MKSFFLLFLSYYVISKHVSRKKKLEKFLKHARTEQYSVDNKTKVEESKPIEDQRESSALISLQNEIEKAQKQLLAYNVNQGIKHISSAYEQLGSNFNF